MIIKSNYIDYSYNISLAGGIDLSTGLSFYSIYARINNSPSTYYFNNSKDALEKYNELEKRMVKQYEKLFRK